VSLKKAHLIKPSDIQRTAALIFSKPPFRNSALLWHSYTPPNNGFFLFRLRGGYFLPYSVVANFGPSWPEVPV